MLIARTDKILRHATACVTEQTKIRAKLDPINDEIAVRRLHDATRPFNAVVPTDDPVGSGEGVAGDDDPFQLVVHEADHFEEESEHSIRHQRSLTFRLARQDLNQFQIFAHGRFLWGGIYGKSKVVL